MRHAAPLLALALAAPAVGRADPPDPKGAEFFERKVRPVLAEHCFPCHSADAAKDKKLRGGLYLDSRDGLLTGGTPAPRSFPAGPPTASS